MSYRIWLAEDCLARSLSGNQFNWRLPVVSLRSFARLTLQNFLTLKIRLHPLAATAHVAQERSREGKSSSANMSRLVCQILKSVYKCTGPCFDSCSPWNSIRATLSTTWVISPDPSLEYSPFTKCVWEESQVKSQTFSRNKHPGTPHIRFYSDRGQVTDRRKT